MGFIEMNKTAHNSRTLAATKYEMRWTMTVSFTIAYQNQRNMSCPGHKQFPLQFLIKINEI